MYLITKLMQSILNIQRLEKENPLLSMN